MYIVYYTAYEPKIQNLQYYVIRYVDIPTAGQTLCMRYIGICIYKCVEGPRAPARKFATDLNNKLYTY